MTPRLTSTLAGTIALGVVLNVLEQSPEGFLLGRGEFVEHRDQHCAVAACPMQKGSEVADHDEAPVKISAATAAASGPAESSTPTIRVCSWVTPRSAAYSATAP